MSQVLPIRRHTIKAANLSDFQRLQLQQIVRGVRQADRGVMLLDPREQLRMHMWDHGGHVLADGIVPLAPGQKV